MLKRLAAAAALLMIISPVNADGWVLDLSNIYLEGSLGKSNYKKLSSLTASDVGDMGRDNAVRALIGAPFVRRNTRHEIAVEAWLEDLGQASAGAERTNSSISDSVEATTLGLGFRFARAFGNNAFLYTRLGGHLWDAERVERIRTDSSTDTTKDSDSGLDGYGAIGLSYDISNHLRLGLEYKHRAVDFSAKDFDIQTLMISAGFSLGRR